MIPKFKYPKLTNGSVKDVLARLIEFVSGLVYYQTPTILTDGATINLDASSCYNATVTLGGNRTLAINNLTTGDYITLKVIQDATGSRTLALPAGTKVSGGGAGAVTLTSTANSVDILTFYYDGTLYCNLSTNFT